jgi:hypothetical protein
MKDAEEDEYASYGGLESRRHVVEVLPARRSRMDLGVAWRKALAE